MRYERVITGTFINRPNRFIAEVEIDGNLVAAREIASDVTAGYDLAEVALDTGRHRLRMTYGNDGFGDGGDRALFIRKLKVLPK